MNILFCVLDSIEINCVCACELTQEIWTIFKPRMKEKILGFAHIFFKDFVRLM